MHRDDNPRASSSASIPTPTALNDEMFAKHGAKSAPASAVDWRLLIVMSPTLLLWLAWGVWLAFVVIPTLFGLHYAAYVPSGNNLAFCGFALTELLAATQSMNMGKIGHSVLFSLAVCLLAYWF